eukprot:CAMPEP_0117551768 /NCGR_PEP_ID=MMETSP0784-20121206/49360_1 /TAXON_ID=39447 /ORGANISM="" /LENGTH=119 /DNA_ID=CAMNT_0005348815 /DNA_START=208 /DNA_END=564 /DNA_ORIENTATION=-
MAHGGRERPNERVAQARRVHVPDGLVESVPQAFPSQPFDVHAFGALVLRAVHVLEIPHNELRIKGHLLEYSGIVGCQKYLVVAIQPAELISLTHVNVGGRAMPDRLILRRGTSVPMADV